VKTKLHNISSIKTGVFARTVTKGEAVYLKSQHFDEYGQLRRKLHADLYINDVIENHLLRPGDVLFSAKGTKNYAALYESQNPFAVASTSFFVIRLIENSHRVLPEYLHWFLNHPTTQKILKSQAIGSSTASISKAVLDELEIYIPDLQTQAVILKINQLRKSEKKLREQIEILREKQIQQQIFNGIK
jgi:restriction endonuclease S subunit